MTDPYDHVDPAVDPEHEALLGLHGTAGTFGGERSDPGFGPDQIGAGLATVTAASTDVVSYGARLDVFHALAKSSFPGYEQQRTSTGSSPTRWASPTASTRRQCSPT